MKEHLKKKLQKLSKEYVNAILDILGDEDGQVLILIYDDESLFELGCSCEACAVNAAEMFMSFHENATHIGDTDRKVH